VPPHSRQGLREQRPEKDVDLCGRAVVGVQTDQNRIAIRDVACKGSDRLCTCSGILGLSGCEFRAAGRHLNDPV
jgi:hypothetical protein